MNITTTSKPTSTPEHIEEGKTIATISYITLFGFVIALILNQEKKNSFVAYHLRQMLGLVVTGFALAFVSIIPILGWIVSFLGAAVMLYMWIVGIMQVTSGQEKPLPLLGKRYATMFHTIFN